ncbi:protein LNK1-like isoform X1 [Typha latifolia]|uniref:protein LNK1-like isoform X1 n=1 Tax=Typha latifolia TaxID=4733 RepID=UPI003C2EFEF2
MQDWKVYEVEENVWNEFAQNDNSVVPNRGGEQWNESGTSSNAHKKSQHVDLGRTQENVIAASKNVDLSSCDPDCNLYAVDKTSNGARLPNDCIRGCKIDSESSIFYEKGTVSGTRDPTEGRNTCRFAVNNDMATASNINLLVNDLKYRVNDLMYYDWPAIDNFEDVDRMFRNCDSTFGQGKMDNADELAWFPSSSNTSYSSDVTLHTGLTSSCSELGVLNVSSGNDHADINILPQICTSDVDYDKSSSFVYQSTANWIANSAENKGICAQKEQAYEGGELELSAINQTQNRSSLSGSGDLDMIGSQYISGENTMQQLEEQRLCADSSSKSQASGYLLKEKHPLQSASSRYMDTFYPYSEVEYNFPTLEVPVEQKTSSSEFEGYETNPYFKIMDHVTSHEKNCMEQLPGQSSDPSEMEAQEKVGKFRMLPCDTVMADNLLQQASTIKGLSLGEHSKSQYAVGCGDPVPTAGIDSSICPENSFVTSVSSDVSLEEISFQQLWNVMNQLDCRTKLCIRDSLYRLARTVKRRHCFSNTSTCSGDSRVQSMEATNESTEFGNVETETNPIDRSIAHLLFHRRSNSLKRAVDDATSLESNITNEQNHAPINNQAAVCDQLFSQRHSKLPSNDQP